MSDHDTDLVATFQILGESQIEAVGRMIRGNWRPFKDRGAPLLVTVTSKQPDRLEGQIRYYFGVLLKAIAEQGWIDGKQCAPPVWDWQFRFMYLPHELKSNPITGEQYVVVQELKRGKIGVKRMAEYINEVEAYAASEMGVKLPARPFE